MFARPMRAGWAGGASATTMPDKPLSIATTAGNAAVTVALVAAHAGDVIQVRYKLATSATWITANPAHQRTGSGNVTVAGLTNELKYDFMAYTVSGVLEYEWIGPAECTPTAGALGAYATFHSELVAALQASAVLAAACTDGLPAAHVKDARYIFTDTDKQESLILTGPVIEVPYKPYRLRPFTHDSAVGNIQAEFNVNQYFNQSASNNQLVLNSFVERLKSELVKGVDGHGTQWSTRAFGITMEVGEPTNPVKDQIHWIVKVSCGYSESLA